MYIRSKPAAISYKLLIGVVALFLEWHMLSQYGSTALRLFPTWVLFITAVYYLSSAFSLIASREPSGKNLCPVIEGAIIVSFMMMSIFGISASLGELTLPTLDDWVAWMLCVFFPILTLFDWILFVKKGRWSTIAPVYWIALPVSYAAVMIFTAEFLSSTTDLRYPLAMFDLLNFGLMPMLSCATTTLILMLLIGYIILLCDCMASGKISKYIILPHIHIVEVDQDGHEIIPEPSHVVADTRQDDAAKIPETKEQPTESSTSSQPDPEIVTVRVKPQTSKTKPKTSSASKPKRPAVDPEIEAIRKTAKATETIIIKEFVKPKSSKDPQRTSQQSNQTRSTQPSTDKNNSSDSKKNRPHTNTSDGFIVDQNRFAEHNVTKKNASTATTQDEKYNYRLHQKPKTTPQSDSQDNSDDNLKPEKAPQTKPVEDNKIKSAQPNSIEHNNSDQHDKNPSPTVHSVKPRPKVSHFTKPSTSTNANQKSTNSESKEDAQKTSQ